MGVRGPAHAGDPHPPGDRGLILPGAPPPPPEDPRWGLGDAAIGFFAGFFASVLFGSLWIGVAGTSKVTLGLTVATLLGQWAGMGSAIAVACRRKGSGSLVADFGLRVEARDIGPGLAAGVLSQLVLVPLLYAPVHRIWPHVDVSAKAREVTDLGKGSGIVLLAACIVIGAPLLEELFFRGLLLRSATRRFGPNWAVALSAVVFGLAHFQPVQLLGLSAFGVVLALLARRSGRLGPSLIAHMAFNATTVVALVLAR